MTKYKITDVIEETGQIQVEFNSAVFMIDLPIDENNQVPQGEELDHYIQGFLPVEIIERQEKFQKGEIDLTGVKAMVESSDIPEEPPEPEVVNINKVLL